MLIMWGCPVRPGSILTPKNLSEVTEFNWDGRLDEWFCGKGDSLDENSLTESYQGLVLYHCWKTSGAEDGSFNQDSRSGLWFYVSQQQTYHQHRTMWALPITFDDHLCSLHQKKLPCEFWLEIFFQLRPIFFIPKSWKYFVLHSKPNIK